ncbi:MFS DHA1 transporter [Gymnopilus junonius]|uniref:MFS DHA1 transporter n=1 Tax=Gymnopilus junonius TaxID=109634 RepID=A0A9P5TIE1_GYMJU|nr:MFS DHA1 transporter [Gymnopilus junonius]
MSTEKEEICDASLRSDEEKGDQGLSYTQQPSPSDSVHQVSTSECSTKEFFYFPIPKNLRNDPERPFEFRWSRVFVYTFSTTILTGNLYYCQPLLIEMAKTFDVSYERVSRIPTCVQAGYAVGLFILCPLGDIFRRRQLVLALVFLTTFLTVGLAVTRNVVVFEVLSLIVGLANVAPQILIPLVAETAPLEKRGFAFSVVLSGLMFGILLARVIAGIIGQFALWRTVYYTAVGIQAVVLGALYFTLPDHLPKVVSIPYWKVHWTMIVLAVTEPIAVQALIMNLGASAAFAYYWVSLTFLLGGPPYYYSTLVIGLFGLVGMAGVAAGPLSGRFVDRLLPWHANLIALIFLLAFSGVQVAAGGIHIAAVIISCFGLDAFQQMQNVAIPNQLFSISRTAISRLNALYMVSYYVGQMIGTSAGAQIFVQYGWRAAALFGLSLYVMQLFALLVRGPHCSRKTWFGYEGGVRTQPRGRAEQTSIQE